MTEPATDEQHAEADWAMFPDCCSRHREDHRQEVIRLRKLRESRRRARDTEIMTTPAEAYGKALRAQSEARKAAGDPGLLPTSAALLRRIAAERRLEAEAAARALTRAETRAEDAEEEAARAEQGIAPPGFYLVNR